MSSHKCAGPLTASKDVEMLENQLKKQTDSKRVRVAEYFGDFDPLRSGSITSMRIRLLLTCYKLLYIYKINSSIINLK